MVTTKKENTNETKNRNPHAALQSDDGTRLPGEFSDLVTRNLNTDYTATRMIGYLSHYSDLPDVEVVDEMLAILSDRNELIKKKESEQAQARISEILQIWIKNIK